MYRYLFYLPRLVFFLLGRFPAFMMDNGSVSVEIFTPEFLSFLDEEILTQLRHRKVLENYGQIAIRWITETETSPYQNDSDFRQAKDLLAKYGLCAGSLGQKV